MNSRVVILAVVLSAIQAIGFAQTASTPESSPATTPETSPASKAPTSMTAARYSDDTADPIQPASTEESQARSISFHRDGLWFSSEDGQTHLQVHGYAQADDRMFSADTHGEPVDTFLFRRIRPLFEGTLFNNVDFRFMPDFGQYNPQIQEAFLELKTLPFAKLRVGKFKEPLGLEVLRQDRDLTFVERSLASDLVPLRYLGAQLSGSVLSNTITYEGGYFNGSADGSNGVFTQWTPGNEAVARVFLHPFAKSRVIAAREFGLGIAGSEGHQSESIPGLKTVGQTTFFKYSSTTVADGQHNRLTPQAYYYAGPFGLMGEYVISSQEVLNKGISGRVRNEAWEAAGSVLLTGEKNGYTGVRARNAFEPGRGFDHFGALELALRYSQLRIGGDAFPHFANPTTAPQFAEEEGIGFNWYLTRYVKLQTDYEHTGFRMAVSGVTPLHSENVLMNQIQLAF